MKRLLRMTFFFSAQLVPSAVHSVSNFTNTKRTALEQDIFHVWDQLAL
jgi:hypothetical protein